MIEYPTVSALIGIVVSKRFATLYELQTIYSIDDVVDMYEIIAVNNYNENEMIKRSK